MSADAPLTLVLRFVEGINAHDVAAMCSLVTADHRLTDSLGVTVTGLDAVRASWASQFATVPDYHFKITRHFVNEAEIVLVGEASGSRAVNGVWQLDSSWSVPAALRATVRNGLLAECQVFADQEPIRSRLRGE